MCGITGFITTSKRFPKLETDRILAKMTATIIHRGPDSHGLWSEPDSGVWLGHQRLAIIDLSSNSNQLFSMDGSTFPLPNTNSDVVNLTREVIKIIGGMSMGASELTNFLDDCPNAVL